MPNFTLWLKQFEATRYDVILLYGNQYKYNETNKNNKNNNLTLFKMNKKNICETQFW